MYDIHPEQGPAIRAATLSAALILALAASAARSYDVNDKLSINLLLAGAGQCEQIAGLDDEDNVCRGALPVQPEIVWNPTKQDQLFLKLGFAAGNGLNQKGPFVLSPWAADLEDDVQDINGRGRNYLLEAWYAHTFQLGADNSIQLTGGLIDPAFYINENAFADDEYTQFMNQVFVDARTAAMPAYDEGGVFVWKYKDLTFSALGMNVGENEDGNNYNYYAAEADYHIDTPIGAGNYRVMYSETSRAFLDPAGESLEHRAGWYLSFDQELGRTVGAFVRTGWQSDKALIDYEAEYSAGLNFKGAAWGREQDNIGIGFAYLQGPSWSPLGNPGIVAPIDSGSEEAEETESSEETPEAHVAAVPAETSPVLARTNVFETYYRFVVNDRLAVSADIQYMQDKYREGEDVDGWIFGLRAVIEL